ncbi:hypothetical protein QBC45DRAFT_323016 [Copromyces sp. CBS 386.78]|nr:hypothetical protein QBC45DRAFT_323016 [Copromyces sp. CBS 386.78]
MLFREHTSINSSFNTSIVSHGTNPNVLAPRRNRLLPNRHTSCRRYSYKTPSTPAENQNLPTKARVSYPSHKRLLTRIIHRPS